MRLSSSDGYRPMPFLMLLGFLLLIFSPRWTLAGGLAGSGQHSLAISAEQSFGYAWGANQTGQIGFAPTATAETSRRYPFLWSPGGQVWTQVASGDWHSVALQADGTVWTWGLNTKGQLGDGTTVDHAQPRPLSELSRVSAVAAGSHHSLAVTEDGRVWAWGENDYRQLGNNSVDTARTPGPVQVWVEGTAARPGHAEDLTGVVAVAASPVHSVALKSDGTVWAWGDNRYGQLGLGNTLSKATAHPVIGLPPVRAITAGGTTQEVLQDNGEVQLLTTAYTLALTADGAVWGWGYNGHCQLGDSEGLVTLTPRALPNLSRLGALRALVSGGGHGVALTADGQVWTWGDNSAGQLGDATPGRRCEPAPVLANGATISAGVAHTLVTTADGAVWAWGKNHQGQLGDGRVDDRQTPEPVKGVCGVGQLNVQTPPPAGCPLTLTQTGDGSGTVTGAGDYAAGAMITLTATPDADSRFDGWKPESCAASFPMPTPARALTCTAMFTRIETVTYLLTLNTTGTGGGVVNGGGNYPAGAPVALTAEPALGSAFIGWSPPPCAATFAMPAAPLTCMATFEPLPIVPLTVLKTGNGTVSGGGQYQVGETVTLTATPQNEAQFASWSPAPCASVFTMPAEPLTCTATFTTGSDPHVVTLVQHYYQAILGRAADPDGQAYWEGEAARMQDLGIDLPEVFRVMAGQFFTSAEYRSKNPSDPQYVTDLYHTFFQREPDVEGLTHWTTQLAAGLPRDIVLYEFLFSAEFTAYMQSQFGDSASRAEALAIVDFYRGLLGRLPDNEGFRYWLDQFQTAQCEGADAINAAVEAISHQFATSTEYQNRQRTNSEYLQDLYNAFLRRGGDLAGFNYWLSQLDSGAIPREPARQAFIATPEFQGRVSQIIQQGCNQTLTQISAGVLHTCVLRSDGKVECWGKNEDGQAMPPTGIFTQVSAGGYHTCGLKSDGAIACWGSNTDLQGNIMGQATPPAGTFTQVSAGVWHTCGVMSNGTVTCWGNNQDGQAIPPAGTFTQISAGVYHTCGVKRDGAIVCWGSNTDFQGNFTGQATPPAGVFTQVSAAGYHTCGVKGDGAVACWGSNTDLQDNFIGQATPPAGAFTQVSASTFHTCGLKRDGTVACWGYNENGQATPPTGRTFTQVSGGDYHTCGLESNGAVACWGKNDYGQATPPRGIYYAFLKVVLTGPGTVTSQPAGIECGTDCGESYVRHTAVTLTATPISNVPFSHWTGACSGSAPTCQVTMSDTQEVGAVFTEVISVYTQVSAGGYHTCGVKSDGAVACWGLNDVGQAAPPAGTFTQVSTGLGHTCGVKNDSTVACWGYNRDGRATTPAGVFTQVSAGQWHTCGLKHDGTVVCWGDNQDGQAAPPAGVFTQVSAGGSHTCSVKSDRTIACWGLNDVGQAAPPTGVFTQVSAGLGHTCGVKSDGMVACWGFDGDGRTTPPAGVFTQVSAGAYHTCGIKSNGTVACWGNNVDGQAARPAGTFTQVSAGRLHTCSVTSDGAVVCWGNNDDGQSTPP